LSAYESYLKLMARLQVNQQLRGRVSPSDVVQDVFLRAQQRFGEFRGTTEGELLAWLRRILASRLVSLVRHHLADRRDARLEEQLHSAVEHSSAALMRNFTAGSDSPSRNAIRREQSVLLAEALDELPADYREVIVLRHLEGKTFAEIATLMSRSVPSIKSIWTRAVSKLRVRLSEDHTP
jgi:RNA polymerase sigma-70 factor (ECF subfamily)